MVKPWPALSRRFHVRPQLIGEVALAWALGAALVVAWSDGTPDKGVVDPVPAVAYTASLGGDNGDHSHLPKPIAIPTSPRQQSFPSARPVMILIPSLDVHRPIEAIGVDAYGALNVPQNLWNAGWYEYGPVPGSPGDAVIEGHAGYPKAPLLFGKLHQLRRGDRIVVVLADGSRQAFTVVSVKSWSAFADPPGLFAGDGPPRLSLITCTGPFDDHYKTYADRLVVDARYAGLA